MTSNIQLADELKQHLSLQLPAVAVAFCDEAPAGVARIADQQPASCSYWRLAAEENRAFVTAASDHYGCPVGSHTHAVELPPDVKPELKRSLDLMVDLSYIKAEEIAGIPCRSTPFRFAVYAPLDQMPLEPDVVIVRGSVRQMMLIAESAEAANIATANATMGRPTCAMIPQALDSGKCVASFGCIGNRVYTGLGDDEGYFAIGRASLAPLVASLSVICNANSKLKAFHSARIG